MEKSKMSRTVNVHPSKSRVTDFIAGLKTLEKDPITSEGLMDRSPELVRDRSSRS
jgi:hypothetical protein